MSTISPPNYTNPGELFTQNFGLPQELEDIFHYAQWLRSEAGLASTSQVDLFAIYSRFGIPSPQRIPLPDQQGMLLNSEIGLVLVNQDDPFLRQRFTEAHELMEFLFEASARNRGWRQLAYFRVDPQRKEKWCDEGAAELLMPKDVIKQKLKINGVSFITARQISAEFQVSLTASLLQLIKASEGHHAVVRWSMKHKPSEIKAITSAKDQMTMFDDIPIPSKELRVDWFIGNTRMLYLPNDKSIANDTAIYKAWLEGKFTKGRDSIVLGNRVVHFQSENQPFEMDDGRRVLSLLTLSV